MKMAGEGRGFSPAVRPLTHPPRRVPLSRPRERGGGEGVERNGGAEAPPFPTLLARSWQAIFMPSGEPKTHDVYAQNDRVGRFFHSFCVQGRLLWPP